MTHAHHAIDYIELMVTDLAAAKEFYAAAFGWAFNDYGPEYSGIRSPDGEGEVGGLNPARAPRTGRAARAALLRRPRRHGRAPSSRRAVGSWRVPYEFPGGRRFHFADPSGNELGVWAGADRDPSVIDPGHGAG